MTETTRLPFTVDARIIAQLGEQLVPSDLMALAELVKNSYDADASVVTIDHGQDAGSPVLVIEDDGNGMTLQQLQDGWMHIGTAEKERTPLSPRYGRPRAGIKGVGRFAAQRLGDVLVLSTTPEGVESRYTVTFKWTEFLSGRTLESILHDVSVSPASADEHGTRLLISGLHREWTLDDLAEVIADLARLHSPSDGVLANGDVTDPGFEVVAASHDVDGVQTVDELDLLRDERVMHLRGTVDEDGNAYFDLEFFRPERDNKRVRYKHKVVTGPLTLDVDLALFSSKWIEDLGVRRAQTIGRKHGGVRIWRDGFRVLPYGAPHDDWLGIDEHIAARRQPLNLWRNQGILGGVRISRERNPDLQDLLTRRGMVETAAYENLRTFVFEGLVVAANEHAALSERKTRSGPRKPKPSEALKSALDALSGRGEDAAEPPTEERQPTPSGDDEPAPTQPPQGVAPEVADKLVKAVRRAEAEIVNENQMLKVLASLGTGLAVFAHEMKTVSLDVAVSASELDRLATDLPASLGPRLQSEASRLRSGIESLTTYARYVEDFVSEDARTHRRSMELSEFIEGFFGVFGPLLDRRGIEYSVEVPRGLWLAPIFKAELISIYFNLMTNAVKALLSPGVERRRLAVTAGRSGDEVVAIFADSGCGVPEDVSEELFEPFVTRSHNPGDASLGRGTGLGLYIVREIVSDYGGEVGLAEPPDGFVTGIEVRLPARRRS